MLAQAGASRALPLPPAEYLLSHDSEQCDLPSPDAPLPVGAPLPFQCLGHTVLLVRMGPLEVLLLNSWPECQQEAADRAAFRRRAVLFARAACRADGVAVREVCPQLQDREANNCMLFVVAWMAELLLGWRTAGDVAGGDVVLDEASLRRTAWAYLASGRVALFSSSEMMDGLEGHAP